jgi:hypothetical protein
MAKIVGLIVLGLITEESKNGPEIFYWFCLLDVAKPVFM